MNYESTGEPRSTSRSRRRRRRSSEGRERSSPLAAFPTHLYVPLMMTSNKAKHMTTVMP
jgi:hypothetical protein